MNKAAITRIIVIGMALMTTGCSTVASGGQQLDQYGEVETSKSIEVEVSNADLHIYPGQGNYIQAHLYGVTDRADRYRLNVNRSGDRAVIRVEREERFGVNIGNDSPRLDLVVPDAVFDKWIVKTSSGDVMLSSPKVLDLDVETSSGEFELTGFNGEKLSIETNSGDVQLKDVTTKDAEVTTSSGEQDLNRFRSNLMQLTSNSGDIKGIAIIGEVNATTSSGSLRLDLQELTKNVQAETNSGDVTISVPVASNFVVEGKTNSGDLAVDIPVKFSPDDEKHKRGTVGKGGPKLTVNTSSGDMLVQSR